LWSSDSRPASRVICALHSSKPISQCTAVRAEGGGLLIEESEVKARWAGYFEQLYQADPPAVEFDVRGVPIPIAELYSGTESALRCGDTISDLFPVVTGVRQECALAPTLFSTCMDWIFFFFVYIVEARMRANT